MIDFKSDEFARAVRNIERRAERQVYEEKLARCFVHNKVLEQLDTNSNQLVYGRRGVGKTHTLKAYLGQVVSRGSICRYIDIAALGAELNFENSDQQKAARLFGKLLTVLAEDLFDDVCRAENPDVTLQSAMCNQMLRIAELRNTDKTSVL